MLVVANERQELAERHPGAQARHEELILGEQDGDPEGLLEGGVTGGGGHRSDPVVFQLTSLIDVRVGGQMVKLCRRLGQLADGGVAGAGFV